MKTKNEVKEKHVGVVHEPPHYFLHLIMSWFALDSSHGWVWIFFCVIFGLNWIFFLVHVEILVRARPVA